MASTNKTTNYELSQFIETDRPAWLTDYNGDMRTLDTALKAVSDVASGASGSISSLTDRMTAAEGAITTNTNDISALDARADALEAGAQSQAGTIAGIQTEQTAQNLGIEAATELGYNLARPYDSASTYAVGDYVLFQNTLYKCVTAIPVGEVFVPAKWLAIKVMDEIGGEIGIKRVAESFTLGTPTVDYGNVAYHTEGGEEYTISGLRYIWLYGSMLATFSTASSSFNVTIPITWATGKSPVFISGSTLPFPLSGNVYQSGITNPSLKGTRSNGVLRNNGNINLTIVLSENVTTGVSYKLDYTGVILFV